MEKEEYYIVTEGRGSPKVVYAGRGTVEETIANLEALGIKVAPATPGSLFLDNLRPCRLDEKDNYKYKIVRIEVIPEGKEKKVVISNPEDFFGGGALSFKLDERVRSIFRDLAFGP